MTQLTPSPIGAGLLLLALIATGCFQYSVTEYRIVSSSMPTRAPTLRGSFPGEDQGRIGGGVWWATLPGTQVEGSPENEGGYLAPAGGASFYATYGFSSIAEVGVGGAVSFGGSQRSSQRLLPFAPPSSRLASGDLGLRFLWPTGPNTRLGFDVTVRINQLRFRWDYLACERNCSSADTAGPYDDVTVTGGYHSALVFTSRLGERATAFFDFGFELVGAIPPYYTTDAGLPPVGAPARAPEPELVLLPRGEVGLDFDLTDSIRSRWALTPALASADGVTQWLVLELGLEFLP